jgi:decaprenylphospho-beta-D-ribofuranose 2-oxidase
MRAKRLELAGWGRYPRAAGDAFRAERIADIEAALREKPSLIARGGGRSYGDQALNREGAVLLTGRLDRLLGFDEATGILECEPGVTFRTLIDIFLPRGWAAPVSPGTGFATLGGAVANDVHGKNHDRVGSFGDHLVWIEVMLANGLTVRLSADENAELFRATIAGMGLTGIITALAVRLMRVASNAVDRRLARMTDLDAFIAALAAARETATYSVGWIDALATGKALGRGILETAEPAAEGLPATRRKARGVPVELPGFLLNPASVRLFNFAYYRRVPAAGRQERVALERFLYPLDAIQDWNRIYGRRGFHQFQCVVPDEAAPRALRRMLEAVSAAGSASFLAVLKSLGSDGRGMLSFPMRGYTLALDFPHRPGVAALLTELEHLTLEYGGRAYLAKDSALSARAVAVMYRRLPEFRALLARIDPHGRFCSDMARRLGIRP